MGVAQRDRAPPMLERGSSGSASHLETAFVGRTAELAELVAAVDDVVGGQGRAVFVGGEPGIGKTSLARRVAAYARERGLEAVWCRCREHEPAPPYWPWIELLRAGVLDLAHEPLAALLLGRTSAGNDRSAPPPGPPSGPGEDRLVLFDRFTTRLAEMARERPLLLVFDDLHGADRSSLSLLQLVVQRIAAAPMLALGLYRDIDVGRQHPLSPFLAEVVRDPGVRRLSLRGLEADDVHRFLEIAAGSAPPAALVETVLRQSGGNPFFVKELVRLLLADHRIGAAGRGGTVVPQSVREVIRRRLDGLSADCDRMLSQAAVIGPEFALAARGESRDGDGRRTAGRRLAPTTAERQPYPEGEPAPVAAVAARDDDRPQPLQELDQAGEQVRPPLQAPRRAHAEARPHQQAQVEPADVHQEPLEDVLMPAQVRPPHRPGLKRVREGPFEQLPTRPEQCLATAPTDATAVGVHGVPFGRFVRPVAAPTVGLRNVAAVPRGGQRHQHRVAVVPLVGHDAREARGQARGGRSVRRGPADRGEVRRGGGERRRQRRRVACGPARERDREHRPRVEVDGLLLLVRQVRAPILHLRDLGVGLVRIHPLPIRTLLAPPPIQPRQLGARRRLDARGVRQLRQKRLVALAILAPHDRPQRRVRLQRRRVHADGLPLDQPRGRQHPQHPGEHLPVGLESEPPPRARQRRVVRRRRVQRQPEKPPQAEGVRHPPRNPALAVEPFEVADQQAAEVHARGHARPAHRRRVERRAPRFDEGVEPRRAQHPLQRFVERVPADRAQLLVCHEQWRLLRPPPPHRHARPSIISAAGRHGAHGDFHHGLLGVLERLTDVAREPVLGLVDEAVRARLVTETAPSSGRYSFSHVLFRDVLYAELPATRRAGLHRRVGEILEEHYGPNLDDHLAELAFHFAQAAPGGEVSKAVAYALRAGNRAAAATAHEEAVRCYESALELLELVADRDERVRCEALLSLSEALWRDGSFQRARATALRAFETARAIGSPTQLGRAALNVSGRALVFKGGPDRQVVAVLEEALRATSEREPALSALLSAQVARELTLAAATEARALAEDAIRRARSVADPAVIALVLESTYWPLYGARSVEHRLLVAREIIDLARQVGDRGLALEGRVFAFMGYLEIGDRAAAVAELEICIRTAERLRQRHLRWLVTLVRGCWVSGQGRLEEFERLAQEALALGQEEQNPTALFFFGFQYTFLAVLRGRFAEVEQLVLSHAGSFPLMMDSYRALLVSIYATAGRTSEARAELERFAARGLAGLPRDILWTGVVTNLASACFLLGEAACAAELYPLLAPYAGQLLAPIVACLGSMDRSLGQLAATMRRWEDAERHFQAALEMNERMHQWLHLAFTQADYARMLVERGDPRDRAKIDLLRADSSALMARLGMDDLLAAAQAPPAGDPDRKRPDVADASAPNVCRFQKEGEFWSVAYQGRVSRLRHRKGFEYLAQLLRSPERAFAALDLAIGNGNIPASADTRRETVTGFSATTCGDTGPALDRAAMDQYRRRRAELQDEIAEAERMNDSLRASRFEEEAAFIAQQLASELGLGGRHRHARSAAERSRSAVTKGIRGAIHAIQRADSVLGRYLAAHVRTGHVCAYVPDLQHPVLFRS